MPEQENAFKSLFDQKIVQPVNRKIQGVDDRIVQLERSNVVLRRCIWGLAALGLINMLLTVAVIVLPGK